MAFHPRRSGHPACDYKAQYRTAVEAGEAADWAALRGLPGRWPYLCRWCQFFHLTKTPPTP